MKPENLHKIFYGKMKMLLPCKSHQNSVITSQSDRRHESNDRWRD